MENNKVIAELVKALAEIRTELNHMNKTLSTIAAQGKGKPSTSEFTGRPAARTGSYSRSSEMSGGPATGDKEGYRFAKKKSAGRGANASKGKLPSKKGGGYPKKAR